MAKKITIIGSDGSPDVTGAEVLIEDTVDLSGVSFGPNEIKPIYTKNYTRVAIRQISDGITLIGSMPITSIINGNTGLNFASGAAFRAFASKSFFRKPGGGAGITYATTQDVINASNIAFDGDSFTAGEGSYNNSFPNQVATLSGLLPYNNGISGTTSAQILARVQAATARLGYSHVLWSGRNDIPVATTAATIQANIASTVAAFGHNRYLVIGILPDNSEASNSANYLKMVAVNTNSATVYGTRFINALTVLQAHGDGSANDNADIAAGRVPRSLQADTLHLNATGYSWIAAAVIAKIALLKVSSNAVISLDAAPAVNPFPNNQLSLPSNSKILVGGQQVLKSDSAGNLFVGDGGRNLTTGANNAGVGLNSFKELTSGNQNAGVGDFLFYNIKVGSENAAVGYSALSGGEANWCSVLGNAAGANINGAYGCVVIGHNTYAQNPTSNFQMSIQEAIYGTNIDGAQGTISTGNIGFFVKAPTARLHLAAGQAAAGKAPLKLSSGVNLTAIENGAFEYDGTNLYFSTGGLRKTVTLT